jgi:antitoxin component of MazEF toxin-antitoxin module
MNPPLDLPPMIRTDESNWFGHNTMAVRVPATIDQILNVNPDYPITIQRALTTLKRAIVNDELITMLDELAPDYQSWERAHLAHRGDTWLGTEWFYAETFFYRHVIQCVRWWETGRDPFAPIKTQEYAGEKLWTLLESTLGIAGNPKERLRPLIYRVLWGNRIDLSFVAAMERGTQVNGDDLLVDESLRAVELLLKQKGSVHLIADNAGTELALDLALVDALLTDDIATNVILHLKTFPTFVSDATPADVWEFLGLLGGHGHQTGLLCRRLRSALDEGRLRLIPNLYWNSSCLLWDMPPNLAQAFQKAQLVIVKGDANYRRMVGDALWPPDTPFNEVTAYFPAPILAMRVLKSDTIIGLAAGMAEDLDSIDKQWRVNGQRGIIQLNEGHEDRQ